MKRILVVSDIHAGSTVAVMPDEVWTEETESQRANRIESNPLQKVLYERWQAMADSGRFDACYVLGDCIDGPNLKTRGFELWTSNLRQQCATAADLLSMVRTRRYYGVQGSYYHVGENTSSDLAIMDMLHGVFATDLVVVADEARIHLAHEVGWSGSPVSKATAPQSELVAAALNDRHFGRFDLLIRGHRHEYLDLKNRNGHVLCCPGWKVRDAFAARKGLRMLADIGFVVLEIRGRDVHVAEQVWTPHEALQFREVRM